MAEKKKVLYIVEAMGGGVFTYIVDLANELVNSYDMYIAYAVRKQTPENYKEYFDKRIHLIEVKNFGRAIDPAKDIAAFFEVKKIAEDIKPDVIHLHSSKAGAIGRVAFNGKIPMFYTPHGYSFLMENYKPMKRRMFKLIESVCAKRNCTTMLNEFIEKILVHERDRKGSIQTTQEVEIYFNFVGRFVPPAFGEVELTPEELEEIRKREERKDRLHQNYLKRKANGKQKEYEERTKAKKKAEIEARKQAIRTEDIARGVFIPVSSLPQLGPRKGA